MNTETGKTSKHDSKLAERRRRQAEQLRANLKKRKDQAPKRNSP